MCRASRATVVVVGQWETIAIALVSFVIGISVAVLYLKSVVERGGKGTERHRRGSQPNNVAHLPAMPSGHTRAAPPPPQPTTLATLAAAAVASVETQDEAPAPVTVDAESHTVTHERLLTLLPEVCDRVPVTTFRLPITPDEFETLFVADGAVFGMKDFQTHVRECTQVTCSAWAVGDDDGLARTLTFRRLIPVVGPFKKEAAITQVQRLVAAPSFLTSNSNNSSNSSNSGDSAGAGAASGSSSGGGSGAGVGSRGLLISVQTSVTGVLYADYFCVYEGWLVAPTDGGCTLSVHVGFHFYKQTTFKGKILTETKTDVMSSLRGWYQAAERPIRALLADPQRVARLAAAAAAAAATVSTPGPRRVAAGASDSTSGDGAAHAGGTTRGRRRVWWPVSLCGAFDVHVFGIARLQCVYHDLRCHRPHPVWASRWMTDCPPE